MGQESSAVNESLIDPEAPPSFEPTMEPDGAAGLVPPTESEEQP